ncbi:hypothetical protein M501DRAFT_1000429 [Patellaria atrata CBS 101060]|uniref:Altered inheritance of mitochondria protein 6 n=1 Tax=Patellaria atrata CBS 101060 TaxID=1346257 RepID=A0A9P4SFB3_9PEZI|nr:hypothetical protein M501DRAFT_1000429 [Patellaria atrata CBS 101060]
MHALICTLCLLPAFVSAIPLLSPERRQGQRQLSPTLQNMMENARGRELYTYPTDLTRGIIPKPFHSHNDYWRDVPFYSALSYGAVSIEADVWLVNGTLYVGHEVSALTTVRTFDSLYIQPILDTLKRQNPVTPFVTTDTNNGVFDTASSQTLYLFIDLKTAGEATYPVAVSALQPLLEAGYLTTFDGDTLKPGPVTVIGTGNSPRSVVESLVPTTQLPRFYFYDAELSRLSNESNVTASLSPFASTPFSRTFGKVVGKGLNDTQLTLLREQVGEAHSRGIAARYWDLPGYPIATRNAVWRTLLEEGVDLLNVDDLEGAASWWQGDIFD